MLWQKLMGASAAATGLQFVGAITNFVSDSGTVTISCDLTSLTGGVSTSANAGDIVIGCIAVTTGTNRDLTCTTSGYTEIADLYADDQDDAQLGVFYKVLSSAETSVEFSLNTTVFNSRPRFACAYVWRGMDTTTVFDATATTASVINTGRPDAPAITTVTDGAVVVAIGFGAAGNFSSTTALTAPSGMENFFSTFSTTNGTFGIASAIVETAGTYEPATFGGGTTDADASYVAATLALRPA
jgi:hypothetical protein